MMQIKYDNTILNKIIIKYGNGIIPIFLREARIAVTNINKEMKLSMYHTKKAPWFYMRGKNKHYPSMPGSPPAVDTSVNIIEKMVLDDFISENKEVRGVQLGILSGSPALYLEEGTKHIAKRPFFVNQIEKYDFKKMAIKILEESKRNVK